METPYDWLTVSIFAGLIVLYLQRSLAEEPQDSLWQYLACSVGCALANYFGNKEHHLIALLLLTATLAYFFLALRPFPFWNRRR